MKAEKLVCIANIVTNEVLRISHEKAMIEFIDKKDSMWRFTDKSIYKRYIDSKVPGSNIPAPIFTKEIIGKDDKPVAILQYVFTGHPSYKLNKKKSSCNKKGKYRFQFIKANRMFRKYVKPIKIEENGKIIEKTGEWVEKEERIIKHVKK